MFLILLLLFSSNCALGAKEDMEQNAVFDSILANTNYDYRERPDPVGDGSPVEVQTSVYMYFLGHIDSARLEFETTMMLRHRWRDPRLAFKNSNLSSADIFELDSLEGEAWFAEKIWTPNVFVENEQSSAVTKLLRDNQFVRIHKNGEVQFNYRLTAKVFCNMDLHRFPHDTQYCTVRLESWTLTCKDMTLMWEPITPLQIFDFIRPEFIIVGTSTTQNTSCYTDAFASPRLRAMASPTGKCEDMLQATRNYSTLYMNIDLERMVGHYVLDYYVPSMLLVAMSWVSFWLHPNAVPGRTTLGTSTWLTIITLTHNTGSNDLPKVSYIKFLDVWFLGCTMFIFASLLEFAFVNSVSRRKETVAVKSLSAASVLPAAAAVFATPAVKRRKSSVNSNNNVNNNNSNTNSPKKSESLTALSLLAENSFYNPQSTVTSMDSGHEMDKSYLSVTATANSIPHISLPDGTELTFDNKTPLDKSADIEGQKEKSASGKFGLGFEDMTGEEIAIWVDMKARIVFPLLFMLFNLVYWCLALT